MTTKNPALNYRRSVQNEGKHLGAWFNRAVRDSDDLYRHTVELYLHKGKFLKIHTSGVDMAPPLGPVEVPAWEAYNFLVDESTHPVSGYNPEPAEALEVLELTDDVRSEVIRARIAKLDAEIRLLKIDLAGIDPDDEYARAYEQGKAEDMRNWIARMESERDYLFSQN